MNMKFVKHLLKLLMLFSMIDVGSLSYIDSRGVAIPIMLVVTQGMPNDVTCFFNDKQNVQDKIRCFLCCDKYLIVLGNTLTLYKEIYYKEIDSVGIIKEREFNISISEQRNLYNQLLHVLKTYNYDTILIFRSKFSSPHQYQTEVIVSNFVHVVKATLIGDVCVPALDSLVMLCNHLLRKRGIEDTLTINCNLK